MANPFNPGDAPAVLPTYNPVNAQGDISNLSGYLQNLNSARQSALSTPSEFGQFYRAHPGIAKYAAFQQGGLPAMLELPYKAAQEDQGYQAQLNQYYNTAIQNALANQESADKLAAPRNLAQNIYNMIEAGKLANQVDKNFQNIDPNSVYDTEYLKGLAESAFSPYIQDYVGRQLHNQQAQAFNDAHYNPQTGGTGVADASGFIKGAFPMQGQVQAMGDMPIYMPTSLASASFSPLASAGNGGLETGQKNYEYNRTGAALQSGQTAQANANAYKTNQEGKMVVPLANSKIGLEGAQGQEARAGAFQKTAQGNLYNRTPQLSYPPAGSTPTGQALQSQRLTNEQLSQFQKKQSLLHQQGLQNGWINQQGQIQPVNQPMANLFTGSVDPAALQNFQNFQNWLSQMQNVNSQLNPMVGSGKGTGKIAALGSNKGGSSAPAKPAALTPAGQQFAASLGLK